LRIKSTHPPSDDTAQGYRRAGTWLPAQTAAEHIGAISSGGSRTALVDNVSQWTFSELATAVQSVRASLAQANVTAGDAVLIITPLLKEAVAGYLAAMYLGAVAVLLDRRCGASDILHACRTARPRVALAFDDDAHRLDLSRYCPVLSLKDATAAGTARLSVVDDVLVDPDVPAAVVFTSGTTSAPKGVVHTINSLRCGTSNMIEALDITSDDALFLSSPLAGITGVLQLHSALTARAKVIMEEHFSGPSSLARVCEHGATVLGGAPVIGETLFAEAERLGRPLALRCIALGGTMIPKPILDSAARLGIRPVRAYGSSEAPFSTATALDDIESLSDEGTPLAGVEIAIRDAGSADELIIRGPHQFHGYLDASHNDDAFVDDWLRTGDQADICSGRLRIKGRLKEIAVRKGMKISLAELDAAASGLGDCAAFAVADEETGERIALAIRSATTTTDVTYVDVVDHLAEGGLAKWKLPEQIVVWDGSYPRTPSGKIIRQQLTDERRHLRTLYAPRITGE
jgi:acyl-CoA synthetase (AMP-forming)/AMP-acid ligase II